MTEETPAVAKTIAPAKKSTKKGRAAKKGSAEDGKPKKKTAKKAPATKAPRTSKVDVLRMVKELGGKSVPTPQIVKSAEKQGIKEQAILRHICQMRKMVPPLVNAVKKGGRATENEEVSITKAGTAALKA